MERLTDEQVWKIFREDVEGDFVSYYQRRDDHKSDFTLEDLVGKTISGYRRIKNNRSFDPTRESPNPEYFSVLEFSDGSMLLTEKWGDLENTHLHHYYYDKKTVRFSSELFGNLEDCYKE